MKLTVARINELLAEGLAKLLAQAAEWDFSREKQSLDTANHVARVFVQEDAPAAAWPIIRGMLASQNPDGGWGEFSNDNYSAIREAAFCTRNLIRLNRRLKDPQIASAVERAVAYLLDAQEDEGGWSDPLWGRSDATSIALSAMMFAHHEGILPQRTGPAVDRGIAFVVRTQADDGGWYDPRFKQEQRLSPVAWTAHILPKVVVHLGDSEQARRGLDLMANAMQTDGAWDGGDVDHTCDSTRALILGSLVLGDDRYRPQFERGVAWLMAHRNPDGQWPTHPGRASSLLITCDGYDTLQKYRMYLQERASGLRNGDFVERWDDF